jgi:hypothetical protein
LFSFFLSIFLSIINNSFRHARENVKNENEEILSFMFRRLERWIGWEKKTMEDEIQHERDAVMDRNILIQLNGFLRE